MEVIPIKRFSITLIVLTMLAIMTACTKAGTYGDDLVKSNEVLVKGEKFEQKITDKDKITNLAAILNKCKPIDPPEKAKGIKPDVAAETVLLHFAKADFFYIGDGYLYYGNKGQYFSVSRDIEKYTTQQ